MQRQKKLSMVMCMVHMVIIIKQSRLEKSSGYRPDDFFVGLFNGVGNIFSRGNHLVD